MKALHLRKSIGPECFRGFLLIPLLFGCFALSPTARADDDDRGHGNTSEGQNALFSLTTGINNTANGYQALYLNTTADDNTATGYQALYFNTTGHDNVATGSFAAYDSDVGSYNTADGVGALDVNGGDNNTAVGYGALSLNGGGNNNTAIGSGALNGAVGSAGDNNTATGFQALYNNNGANGANNNTAIGYQALYSNTTGSNNTAIGYNAGFHIGGSGNVCIGQGVQGVAGESNTTRIRNVYASMASARIVYVNSNNKIGTLTSTRRVKENIKPMDKASEAILALKPVSFRYKKEIDASGTPQFGLIAEEVADINPDLVTRDAEGKPETVRYDSINAMLLNEFLKEHRTVQELKSTVAKQESTIAQQQKDFQSRFAQQQKDFQAAAARQQTQIEALSAGLQKVSTQVEMSRPAPQLVLNNQ